MGRLMGFAGREGIMDLTVIEAVYLPLVEPRIGSFNHVVMIPFDRMWKIE